MVMSLETSVNVDAAIARKRETRRTLLIAAMITGGFGFVLLLHGVVMTVQLYSRSIDSGVVASVEHRAHYDLLSLDGGRTAFIPKDVLFSRGEPFKLAPGDRVSKRSRTLAYTVNGGSLGGRQWVIRQYFTGRPTLVLLGVAVVFALVHRFTARRVVSADVQGDVRARPVA
jgi:hypothetical protein